MPWMGLRVRRCGLGWIDYVAGFGVLGIVDLIAFAVGLSVVDQVPKRDARTVLFVGGLDPLPEDAGAFGVRGGLAVFTHVGDLAGGAGDFFVAANI